MDIYEHEMNRVSIGSLWTSRTRNTVWKVIDKEKSHVKLTSVSSTTPFKDRWRHVSEFLSYYEPYRD